MFSTTIFTNLDECRTECEISDGGSVVAVVSTKGAMAGTSTGLGLLVRTNIKTSTPALLKPRSAFLVM